MATMPLAKFELYSPCVKCGLSEKGRPATVKWYPRWPIYADIGLLQIICGRSPPIVSWREGHIERTCRRCGFAWKEAPLDAPEKTLFEEIKDWQGTCDICGAPARHRTRDVARSWNSETGWAEAKPIQGSIRVRCDAHRQETRIKDV